MNYPIAFPFYSCAALSNGSLDLVFADSAIFLCCLVLYALTGFAKMLIDEYLHCINLDFCILYHILINFLF